MAFGVTATYAWSSWHVSCLEDSSEREGGLVRREEEQERKRGGSCVFYHTQHVCVWCCHRHFPSVCLDPAREQFQDHSNMREKILNQCFRRLLKAGLAFDAATSGESERKRKMRMRKRSLSPSTSPLRLLLTFAFFPSIFLHSLSSLLTAIIVSFSLSKNIVFLPRYKGGEISTCVLPFHLRGGERNLGGNQVS